MAPYRSLLLATSLLLGAHCSPDESSRLNHIQHQVSEHAYQMFTEIWTKYTHGEFMSHEQLNAIMHDTDHELGDQLLNDTEWLSLCEEKGADPNKGLSRDDFLSMYFDDKTHPESSIKKDYVRIFAEGGTPPPPKASHSSKNLLQKSAPQVASAHSIKELLDSISTEDVQMFAAIWEKYADGDFMSHEQLNSVMSTTDQELGNQLLNDTEWVLLCEEKGADPRKGLSRYDFLSMYFDDKAHPESSIKKDYMRIFAEGGTPPPSKDAHPHKNLLQQSGQEVASADVIKTVLDSMSSEDFQMFAEIWEKYADEDGDFMSHDQLNSVMRATDHEIGDQLLNDTEWLSLCKEKGADPFKGLSRYDFLSMYFDDKVHPESSIKKDYMRIFAQGGTPPPSKDSHSHKTLLQKSSQRSDLMDSVNTEDAFGKPAEQFLVV